MGVMLTHVVVVEKPFTNSSAAAERLIALAKEKGRILTVFQSKMALNSHSVLVSLTERQTGDGTVTSAP